MLYVDIPTRPEIKALNGVRAMLSLGVVYLALIVTVVSGAGLLDQGAMTGKLMTGASLIGAMVSRVRYLAL